MHPVEGRPVVRKPLAPVLIIVKVFPDSDNEAAKDSRLQASERASFFFSGSAFFFLSAEWFPKVLGRAIAPRWKASQ